jgi:hypothetical protein
MLQCLVMTAINLLLALSLINVEVDHVCRPNGFQSKVIERTSAVAGGSSEGVLLQVRRLQALLHSLLLRGQNLKKKLFLHPY